MLLLNNNSIWTTADGRKIKFKDLTDTHLANIIDFIKKTRGVDEVSYYLEQLAFERGLKREFLERAQIPYKNKNNKWEIWSSTLLKFIQLEN